MDYLSCLFEQHMSEATEMGVSLILVDRTLDLCTPTSNSAESFLTKILRTFPRLPHHNNDVAIGMSPIFGTVEVKLFLQQIVRSTYVIAELNYCIICSVLSVLRKCSEHSKCQDVWRVWRKLQWIFLF